MRGVLILVVAVSMLAVASGAAAGDGDAKWDDEFMEAVLETERARDAALSRYRRHREWPEEVRAAKLHAKYPTPVDIRRFAESREAAADAQADGLRQLVVGQKDPDKRLRLAERMVDFQNEASAWRSVAHAVDAALAGDYEKAGDRCVDAADVVPRSALLALHQACLALFLKQ